jgi:hypothetical protein
LEDLCQCIETKREELKGKYIDLIHFGSSFDRCLLMGVHPQFSFINPGIGPSAKGNSSPSYHRIVFGG